MKPKSGCWTCKGETTSSPLPLNGLEIAANIFHAGRKVGCDKGLPNCNNCIRIGRECLGYGVRLVWPDRPDGRRSKTEVLCQEPPRPCASEQQRLSYHTIEFLNVTFDDIEVLKYGHSYRPLIKRRLSSPARSLSLHPVVGQDAMLLSYCKSAKLYNTNELSLNWREDENRIATMISTTHTRNGFHHDLLPMALTASCPASSALRNAMLAISAYHSCGTLAALPYKTNAVSHLSRALASNFGGIDIQMAASMMLCVYNVSCD